MIHPAFPNSLNSLLKVALVASTRELSALATKTPKEIVRVDLVV